MGNMNSSDHIFRPILTTSTALVKMLRLGIEYRHWQGHTSITYSGKTHEDLELRQEKDIHKLPILNI